MQLRRDNVCTVCNVITPIWLGDLPHLCSHLLASYAPVNYRGTDVCCDSAIAHEQLPAFEDCVFVVFRFPLHGMKTPHLRKEVALSTKACFSIPSKRCCMFCFVFFSSAPSDVTKTDFHPAFLDASEPAAPFYVRSG